MELRRSSHYDGFKSNSERDIKSVFQTDVANNLFSTFGRSCFECDLPSSSLLKDHTKSLLTPWKRGSTKWYKYRFCAYAFGYDWYLFQLIVLLKPDFNCWSTFVLSWVGKVTTGT